MKEFWDERYKNSEFAYGTEANQFFRTVLSEFNLKGDILLPAEGEGRNAVFAAKSGLNVTAFDQSKEGRRKAMLLANSNNVEINYLVGEIEAMEFEKSTFDSIALVFAHFPPGLRSEYHEKIATYLKKGGILIIEGFSKNHIVINKTNKIPSGPPNIDMLFSVDEIKDDFPGFQIIKLSEEEIILNEGFYHRGKASVIRYIAKKA